MSLVHGSVGIKWKNSSINNMFMSGCTVRHKEVNAKINVLCNFFFTPQALFLGQAIPFEFFSKKP